MSEENIEYAFMDSNIRGYPQDDGNWWEPPGYYLSILLNDREEFDQVKNHIITDKLIVEHTMNCKVCRNQGLFYCDELANLKGGYS